MLFPVTEEPTVSGGRPPDSFDAWVLETAPRAVAYARSLLRDPDRAEDVVQDCYCRLLAKADVYDLPRDGLKLLMRAVTNACINVRTRRRGWFRLVRESDGGTDDPPDPAALPADRHLMHKELSDAVADGLRQLPPQQRAALELKCLGHSQHEIAEMLNISPTNAGVLVFRARRALADYLAPYLGEETVR